MSDWKRKNRLNASVKIGLLRTELDQALTNGNYSTQELDRTRRELNQAYRDEEVFWKMKSRNNWMQLGDRNTKFFYATTKQRIARNRIMAIEDESGYISRGDEEIGVAAVHYFTHLFKTTRVQNTDYSNVFAAFRQK